MAENILGQRKSKPVQAIKLLFILLLLPLIIGFIRGLISQINHLGPVFRSSLYWGTAVYLIFHVFLLEPVRFYKKTQRFIQIIFGFFSPLFRTAYYIVPFWIIVVIGFFILLCKIFRFEGLLPFFFFISGFLFSMHIVMAAKILKVDKIKKVIDYLFIIFIVVIINIFFLSLNIKLYEPGFSVSAVGKEGLLAGINLAQSIWNQLFVPEVIG
jgi:hypothetical protein